MIKTIELNLKTEIATHLICDGCGLEASLEGGFEAQEFLRHKDTGGFGSIFGDMNKIELDLCQHCVKAKLGDIIRITNNDLHG